MNKGSFAYDLLINLYMMTCDLWKIEVRDKKDRIINADLEKLWPDWTYSPWH